MQIKNCFYLIIIILIFECKKKENDNIWLKCQNNLDLGRTETLTFYKDSSYIFVIENKSIGLFEKDSIKGKYLTKNDSIFLLTSDQNISQCLLIKDGYLNMNINDQYRMEIVYSEDEQNIKKSEITNDSSYSIFLYSNKEFKNFSNYYDTLKIKPFEINNKEFKLLKELSKSYIDENSKDLRKYQDYIFQGVCIINEKNEKEVWLHGYCNDISIKKTFKYYFITMFDGGNCNIQFKINLTNKQKSKLGISGEA